MERLLGPNIDMRPFQYCDLNSFEVGIKFIVGCPFYRATGQLWLFPGTTVGTILLALLVGSADADETYAIWELQSRATFSLSTIVCPLFSPRRRWQATRTRTAQGLDPAEVSPKGGTSAPVDL